MPQLYLEYTFLKENGIHHFKFLESTRRALDEWISILEYIYSDVTVTDTIRILIDVRISGSLPLAYASRRGRAWMNSLPFHPPIRVAMLHPADLLRSVVNRFIHLLNIGHLSARIFGEDGEAEAVRWLAQC